jgi:hypothetical protein
MRDRGRVFGIRGRNLSTQSIIKINAINLKNEILSFLFIILRVANFLPHIPHAVLLPEDGQDG